MHAWDWCSTNQQYQMHRDVHIYGSELYSVKSTIWTSSTEEVQRHQTQFNLPLAIWYLFIFCRYSLQEIKKKFFWGNPIFCFSRGHVNVIVQTHMKCNKFELLDPPLCPEMIIDVVEIVYLMRSEDVLVVSWQPHTLRKFWRYSIEGKNVGHFQSIDAHDPFQ